MYILTFELIKWQKKEVIQEETKEKQDSHWFVPFLKKKGKRRTLILVIYIFLLEDMDSLARNARKQLYFIVHKDAELLFWFTE